MKKLSKILALSLALSLTFGMTVFAADSADEGKKWADKVQQPQATVSGSDTAVDVKIEPTKNAVISDVKEDIADASSTLAKAVVTAAGFSKSKALDLIFVLDIQADADGKAVTVTFEFPGLKAAAADQKYVLMHEETAGNWKAVPNAEVKGDKVTFTSSSFSNYALFLVTKEETQTGGGTTPAPAPAPAPAAPEQPLSPKTGETMPVAVFAAMIFLAGAAVCAKKAQLNK